jgi:hypothetical protein
MAYITLTAEITNQDNEDIDIATVYDTEKDQLWLEAQTWLGGNAIALLAYDSAMATFGDAVYGREDILRGLVEGVNPDSLKSFDKIVSSAKAYGRERKDEEA